jgi:hypothetical protein
VPSTPAKAVKANAKTPKTPHTAKTPGTGDKRKVKDVTPTPTEKHDTDIKKLKVEEDAEIDDDAAGEADE